MNTFASAIVEDHANNTVRKRIDSASLFRILPLFETLGILELRRGERRETGTVRVSSGGQFNPLFEAPYRNYVPCNMLDAFKIKPFDLEPIFASWTDGPRFTGNPKKDPPVDEWLNQIKEGCVQRKVPQEYWHKVGRHFMEPKAKARDIDASETETIRVQTKPSGIFWFTKNKTEEPESVEEVVETKDVKGHQRPTLSSMRSDSLWLMRKNSKNAGEQPRGPYQSNPRQQTLLFGMPGKRSHPKTKYRRRSSPQRLFPRKLRPLWSLPRSRSSRIQKRVRNPFSIWLLNACNALDFLTTEHPKTMTTISAVLITVGTLPATLVAAGVGGPVGAVLASHAAQAVSAVALGVGNLLKAQTDGQVQVANAPATSTVR
ncbi:hypothetical protein IMY05_C4727000800 [Salix suchowensis]|nr:hypothetical protein IMY05_C4727000800 [Salix suchowensis]